MYRNVGEVSVRSWVRPSQSPLNLPGLHCFPACGLARLGAVVWRNGVMQ